MSELDKEIAQETANSSTASVQNSDAHSQSSQPNGGQPYFGTPQQPQFAAQTPYGVPYPQPRRSNGIGTAGFVVTLVNMVLGFIPFVNFLCIILWPLGLILSIIGMLKSPRGLAIAGFVLSLLGVILLLILLMIGAGAALLGA